MAVLSELRACVDAGDWDGAEQALDEYRRELEAVLLLARAKRRESGTELARVRAADRFVRQGFGASPGS
jgi:hypothetical protein